MSWGRRHGVTIGRGVDPLMVWLGMYLAGEELSSEKVADKAGISGFCLRAWINGRRAPRLMDVRAVLEVLGYELVLRKKNRKRPLRPNETHQTADTTPAETVDPTPTALKPNG